MVRRQLVVDVVYGLVVSRRPVGRRRVGAQVLRHADLESGVDGVLHDGRLVDVEAVREAVDGRVV